MGALARHDSSRTCPVVSDQKAPNRFLRFPLMHLLYQEDLLAGDLLKLSVFRRTWTDVERRIDHKKLQEFAGLSDRIVVINNSAGDLDDDN